MSAISSVCLFYLNRLWPFITMIYTVTHFCVCFTDFLEASLRCLRIRNICLLGLEPRTSAKHLPTNCKQFNFVFSLSSFKFVVFFNLKWFTMYFKICIKLIFKSFVSRCLCSFSEMVRPIFMCIWYENRS